MILGRPTNLWLGLATTTVALIQGLAVSVFGVDGQQAATVGALVVAFLGAGIALVAGQPPILKPGDPYTVLTPNGDVNIPKIANTNTTPVPPVDAAVEDATVGIH